MKPSPQVAVIVVSYNTRDLLLDCLCSVVESTNSAEVEIVVVDNDSSDGSAEAVRQTYPHVATIRNEANLGFGVACNQAIRATAAPLILLLNSDARLTSESFLTLCDAINLSKRCGAAGCQLLDSDGAETINTRNFLTPFNQALEHLGLAGTINSKYFQRTYYPSPDKGQLDCSVDWISGACMMLRRSALDDVGLFDEQFFMYSEDEDLCLRLKQNGWTICYSTSGKASHEGAGSSAKNEAEMLREFYCSQILFLSKHRGIASVRMYLAAMNTVFFLKRLSAWLLPGEKLRREELSKRQHALRSAWSIKKRSNSADYHP